MNFAKSTSTWEEALAPSASKKTKVDQDEYFEIQSSDSSDDEDNVIVISQNVAKAQNTELNYNHVTPLNNQKSKEGSVDQVEFHPLSKVGMVNLQNGSMDLFQVDGDKNSYLHQFKIDGVRNVFAKFKPDGKSIVACKSGTVYEYDMQQASVVKHSIPNIQDFSLSPDCKYMACRKQDLRLQIVSANTFENCFAVRLNGPVVSSIFTKSGDLITFSPGRIFVWDTRKTNICKHKFQDYGGTVATAMAYSDAKGLLAIGQNVGVVNLYSFSDCIETEHPKPIKFYDKLTSKITSLQFNSSGDLLLMASKEVYNAIKLIDSDSGNTFRNFPKVGKQYKHINGVAFSPNSGYLALGTSTGAASLIRLNQYSDY